MTREELKEHCLNEIKMCEVWARLKGEEPYRKVYEEHKLILELLEQEPILDKIRAEIEQIDINGHISEVECFRAGINIALNIINKYKTESEG